MSPGLSFARAAWAGAFCSSSERATSFSVSRTDRRLAITWFASAIWLAPSTASSARAARAVHRTDQHRLHDALGLDRRRQFGQRDFVHARARLVLAGLDLRELETRGRVGGCSRRVVGVAAEQRVEAAAESFQFFRCHDVVVVL